MTATKIIAQRGCVSGRVQGVAYRAATRHEALRLGLRGYARNLADGRVEVLAVGDADAVAELVAWLHRGPPHARVESVNMNVVDVPAVTGFFVE